MNNNQHPSVPGECHHELADLLDHLLNLPLGSQDEVEEWYETASSAEEFLETHWSDLTVPIPHDIYHFFSDADIRAKESGYRVSQEDEVRRLIALLRSK